MTAKNEERFLTLLLELHVKMNRLETEVEECKKKNEELKRTINSLIMRDNPLVGTTVPPKDSSKQTQILKRPWSVMDLVY